MRLEAPDKPKKKDSDARLADKPKAKKGDSDVGKGKDAAVVPTEEIALDFSGPGSAVIKGGSSAKLSAPKSSSKLTASDSGKGLSQPPGYERPSAYATPKGPDARAQRITANVLMRMQRTNSTV